MARLTNGFHHLSMKRACVNIRSLIRARATGSEMITIEKGKERQGFAAYTSFSKHYQVHATLSHLIRARATGSEMITIEKGKERQGFAAYTSFSKHYQDLYEKMGVVRLSSPLHTSCERLLAEKSRNIVDESKVEEKSKLIDNTTEKHSDGNSKGTQPPLPEARNPVSWLSLGLMVMTGAGLIFYFDQEKKRLIDASRQGSIESKPGPGAGKAAIGGPFKLINHEGKEITNEDLKGNWALLYFGFTHCPDICPDELQKMVEAIDVIEKRDSLQITPVFISIDPERDNVEQIREYVKEFHPRLLGLTGNLDEIRQVARAYRVYYMKTEEDGSDYLVDHSIIMYLMDPKMEFVKFFGKNYDVNGLADGIIDEIKRYK